jgi:hypothetical protein
MPQTILKWKCFIEPFQAVKDLVRLVVRDAEGQLMSAANAAVEIPR